jgi:hypothetical protein
MEESEEESDAAGMVPGRRSGHRLNEQDQVVYLETLRRMTPAERLRQTFVLTEFSRSLFKQGLKLRFPEKSEVEIDALFLERIDSCHNRNY